MAAEPLHGAEATVCTSRRIPELSRECTASAVRALLALAKGDEPEAAGLAMAELRNKGLANLIDPHAEPRLPEAYAFALIHGRWPSEADYIDGTAEPRGTHEQRVDAIAETPINLMGEIGK